MAFRTFWTALCRPIAGLGWWAGPGKRGELRTPIAFLVWVGWRGLKVGGWFEHISEIHLGVWVIVKTLPYVLVFVVIWKVFTELLYPIALMFIIFWLRKHRPQQAS